MHVELYFLRQFCLSSGADFSWLKLRHRELVYLSEGFFWRFEASTGGAFKSHEADEAKANDFPCWSDRKLDVLDLAKLAKVVLHFGLGDVLVGRQSLEVKVLTGHLLLEAHTLLFQLPFPYFFLHRTLHVQFILDTFR